MKYNLFASDFVLRNKINLRFILDEFWLQVSHTMSICIFDVFYIITTALDFVDVNAAFRDVFEFFTIGFDLFNFLASRFDVLIFLMACLDIFDIFTAWFDVIITWF